MRTVSPACALIAGHGFLGFWLCVVCVICSGLRAQEQEVLFSASVVHTVQGPTLKPGAILVRGSRIIAVGERLEAPQARKVDLTGLHLYPGLFALNTGLGLREIDAVRATVDQREVGDFTPEVTSWVAVNPDSELLPVARAQGIAFFEPVPTGGVVAGQSGLLRLDGWGVRDMIVKAPLALHVFWPQMNLDPTPRDQSADPARWKSLVEQARERTAGLKTLEDFLRQAEAYARGRGSDWSPAPTAPGGVPVWEAMLPFVRGERPIVVHADEIRQIRAVLQWAETNRWRVILAGGRDAWREARRLAALKIPVIYEHVFTRPARDTDSYDVHYRAPEILRQAGVTVLFSTGVTDASLVKNLPYHAAQAVAHGLPAGAALRALTWEAARCHGLDNQLGSLEPGKEATFFACSGDLLDVRTRVERMWIRGREVSLENRHTRLYEKYRQRPAPQATH
ncbi:MAG: amidohydrolase family protein [Verrucomicrobiota bacterium]|nr:amidohydrolase family protein [Limisphaera sp.]MDW8381067.1 amidohydrolase family protein [Verrucomicrobiota bacterium]